MLLMSWLRQPFKDHRPEQRTQQKQLNKATHLINKIYQKWSPNGTSVLQAFQQNVWFSRLTSNRLEIHAHPWMASRMSA